MVKLSLKAEKRLRYVIVEDAKPCGFELDEAYAAAPDSMEVRDREKDLPSCAGKS